MQATDGGDAASSPPRSTRATGGATEYAHRSPQAIDAIPGVEQQRATFNQIIGVTVVIAVVVVALFFALLTVERTGLYGVLKAIGRQLEHALRRRRRCRRSSSR